MTAAKWVTTPSEKDTDAARCWQQLFDEFQPKGFQEIFYLKEIFKCVWKIGRVERAELASIRLNEKQIALYWILAMETQKKADPETDMAIFENGVER
jgi:hypothetical protein